jgi:hypothetical protein
VLSQYVAPDYGNHVTEIRQALLSANTSKVLDGAGGIVQILEEIAEITGNHHPRLGIHVYSTAQRWIPAARE